MALMQRLCTKRQEMEKQTSVLCPRIHAMLQKEKAKTTSCEVMPSAESIFSVRYYLDQLNVALGNKSCTCRKWDLFGVPCFHAIARIFFLNQEAGHFVDDFCKRDFILKADAYSIPPCEGERYWPRMECNIDPFPLKLAQIGLGRLKIHLRIQK